MSDALNGYFEALARLQKRKARINNDTVALEAGRKKGSIKKSRAVFSDLILAIDAAAATLSKPSDDASDRLLKVKQSAKTAQERLDAALKRELSLLHELYELKRKLSALTGKNVLPIRGTTL